MTVGPQQFWLGHRAGQTVTLWMDTTTVHRSNGGSRIKTVLSRLSTVDPAQSADLGLCGVGPPGFEPGTYGLKVRSSAIELEARANDHSPHPIDGTQHTSWAPKRPAWPFRRPARLAGEGSPTRC